MFRKTSLNSVLLFKERKKCKMKYERKMREMRQICTHDKIREEDENEQLNNR